MVVDPDRQDHVARREGGVLDPLQKHPHAQSGDALIRRVNAGQARAGRILGPEVVEADDRNIPRDGEPLSAQRVHHRIADFVAEWLAYATLSFEGCVDTWLILGFDPIMTDVYGSEEMKAPNKFFDYYGDDIFDVVQSVLDDIPDTCITDMFPTAADIVRNQMAYDLVIGGVDPAEIAENCAEELRDAM